MKKLTHVLIGVTLLLVAGTAMAVGLGIVDGQTAIHGALLAEGAIAADMKKLEAAFKSAMERYEDNLKKTQDTLSNAIEEVRKEGTLHAKTNEKLNELGTSFASLNSTAAELKERIRDVEQKVTSRAPAADQPKSNGRVVIESEAFKNALASGSPVMGRVKVPGFYNVITSDNQATTSDTGTLVQPQRTGLHMMQQQPLTLRDLLSVRMTTSNLIEFVRQTTRTNNAGVQGAGSSPSGQYDGQPLGQSNMVFTLYNAPVRTIGTWIPASRQILADADQLQGRINGELTYLLKVKEEDQLLNGDNSGGNINGLVNQATAFNGGVTNATALDTILRAFLQVTLAYYQADAVVLNPTDWHNIVMLKDTQGRYLFSDPQSMTVPRLWGRPVAECFSQTAGTFLTGAFRMGATVWDRQDASVRIADQHEGFAVANMVAVIADERLALEVTHPGAFVTGNVSHAG